MKRLILISLSLFSLSLFSQKVFNGSSGNRWNNAGNWTPAGIPSATDDVIIQGFYVEIRANSFANSVTLNPGAGGAQTFLYARSRDLTITNDLTLNQNINNTGDVKFGTRSGAEITVGGSVFMDRTAVNTSNAQMALELRGALLNIAGDLNVSLAGGANETRLEFDINNSEINLMGDLDVDVTSADADFNVDIRGGTEFNIAGSFFYDEVASGLTPDNDDLFITVQDNSDLVITGSMIINKNSGDDINITIQNTGVLDVANDIEINASNLTGTATFLIDNTTSNCDGNLIMNLSDMVVSAVAGEINLIDANFDVGGNVDIDMADNQSSFTFLVDQGSTNVNIRGDFLFDQPVGITNTNDDLFFTVDNGADLFVTGSILVNKNQGDEIFISNTGGSGLNVTTDMNITASNLTGRVGISSDNSLPLAIGQDLIFNLSDLTGVYTEDLVEIINSQMTVGRDFFVTGSDLVSQLSCDFTLCAVTITRNTNINLTDLAAGFDWTFLNGDIRLNNDLIITADNLATGLLLSLSNVQVLLGNDLTISAIDFSDDLEVDVSSANFQIGGDYSSSYTNGTTAQTVRADNCALQAAGFMEFTNVGQSDLVFTVETGGFVSSGTDMTMTHSGSISGGDIDVNVEIGGLNVGNDWNISTSSTGDADVFFDITAGGSSFVTGDVNFDMNSGDDLLINLNAGTLNMSNFFIDKEIASDEVALIIENGATLTASGDITINHDGDNGDSFDMTVNGAGSAISSVNFVPNFDIDWGNVNSTDNDFSFAINNSATINISNDFLVTMSDARDFVINASNDSEISVGRDMHIDRDGGRNVSVTLGNAGGNGMITVARNLNLDMLSASTQNMLFNMFNTSVLDVNGDILFNAAAQGNIDIFLRNTSELQIAGALNRAINGSEFGTITSNATAKVIYDGSAPQVMEKVSGGGTDEIRYGIVEINNTSGVLPAVTLEGDVVNTASVVALELTNGQLYLNQQELIVTSSATNGITRTNGSVLSEDTDNSSTLSWQVGTTTGAHIFPFSTVSGNLMLLTLDLTSGSMGTASVATYPTTSANLPFSPTVTQMNGVDGLNNTDNAVDRHWQIDVTGTPIVDVSIPYINSEFGAPNNILEADLKAQRWNAGTSKWDTKTGTVDTGNDVVVVTGVTQFSPWVLVDGSDPLPVDFIDFEIVQDQDQTMVKWGTTSEVNNDYFDVLHSKDGLNYHVMGTVDGKGNSRSRIDYSFVTDLLENGQHYFKVRQVDFDGQSDETPVRSILISNGSLANLSIVPNVINAGSIVNLIYSGDIFESVDLKVFNVEGTMVTAGKYQSDQLSAGLPINVQELTSGTYFVELRIGDNMSTSKLIVR